jgi:hypothetical protein
MILAVLSIAQFIISQSSFFLYPFGISKILGSIVLSLIFFSYHLWADKLYIFDGLALKIIQLDLEGNIITHFKLEGGPYSDFSGVNDRWIIFMKMIYPPLEDRKGSYMIYHVQLSSFPMMIQKKERPLFLLEKLF